MVEHPPSRLKRVWQKYGIPLIVLLLAIAVIVTITRNWNGWEGSRVDQVTNDAYVRGDLTPLSTKVPGLAEREILEDKRLMSSKKSQTRRNRRSNNASVAVIVAVTLFKGQHRTPHLVLANQSSMSCLQRLKSSFP
jgi:hypothetical protein